MKKHGLYSPVIAAVKKKLTSQRRAVLGRINNRKLEENIPDSIDPDYAPMDTHYFCEQLQDFDIRGNVG